MEFHEIIAKAIKAAKTQRALADIIEESESNLAKMIKGKRAIPAEKLRRIAILLNDGTTPGQIWEAQQAARAESEEERQLWLPFVKGSSGLARAACVLMTLGLSALMAVTLFLTTAENAQAKTTGYNNDANNVNIIVSLRRRIQAAIATLQRWLLPWGFEG